MLNITSAQFALLQDAALRRYEGRVSDWLASDHADDVPADPVQRLHLTERVVAEGMAAGLTAERDLAGFAAASALLGEGFARDPRNPWAAAVLRDGQSDKGMRLKKLAQIIRDERAADMGGP